MSVCVCVWDLFNSPSACGCESWLSGRAVLTAFYLQSAVLLIQRVAAQVHHAGSSRSDAMDNEGRQNFEIHQRPDPDFTFTATKQRHLHPHLRLCNVGDSSQGSEGNVINCAIWITLLYANFF